MKKTKQSTETITSVLSESRVFKPRPEFSKRAHIKSLSDYKKLYNASVRNPEKFWAEAAGELVWFKKWRKVLQWKLPFAKWFIGGKLNVSYNCLDRHLGTWRRNKAALVWEGEPGDTRILTYQQLHREVCKFANVLKRLGVAKGDRVILYLPLIPELAIAMLACTRIGATHSIIFGGFSSQALVDRISDAQATVVVT
ncbi:MAG TPA: AMP-binding protein, partial [Acidobacteriota bacterium]|nr:AMP-binding protein [Acidobacteriota bacterium]